MAAGVLQLLLACGLYAAEASSLEGDGDPQRSKDIANHFWRRTQHKRTVYFCPIGGFGNMMISIAAVLETVRQLDVNVKFVYSNKLYWEFAGSWDDYFSEPDLLLAPFPGCEEGDVDCWMPTDDKASCSMVSGSVDLMATLKDSTSWERQKDGSEAFCFVGGVHSYGVPQQALAPYYRMLKPSAGVAKRIDEVKRQLNWGVDWVGVHMRRGDIFQHPMFNNWWRERGVDQLAVDHEFNASEHAQQLPYSWQVERYIEAMDAIALSSPTMQRQVHFYLSTDDDIAAERVISAFPHGRVVAAPKNLDENPRGSVQGQADAFLDMWMLASCRLLVGTLESTFSLTAHRIGSNYMLLVGCHPYDGQCMGGTAPPSWTGESSGRRHQHLHPQGDG